MLSLSQLRALSELADAVEVQVEAEASDANRWLYDIRSQTVGNYTQLCHMRGISQAQIDRIMIEARQEARDAHHAST